MTTRPTRASRRTIASGRTVASALLLCIAVLLAGGVVVACGDDQPAAPSGDPSITGVATAVSPVDEATPGVGSFRIDQGSGDYDKASVTVTDDTTWYRRDGGGFVTIERPQVAELEGKTVEVQFTGPVAESYPVQATAGWVIVGD